MIFSLFTVVSILQFISFVVKANLIIRNNLFFNCFTDIHMFGEDFLSLLLFENFNGCDDTIENIEGQKFVKQNFLDFFSFSIFLNMRSLIKILDEIVHSSNIF